MALLASACAGGSDEVDSLAQAGQVLTPEAGEANNTPESATVLTGAEGVVAGHLFPGNDNDYYAITAPAGSFLYAATMTAFADTSGGTSDSILGVYGADGTTLLEEDDDNGVMTGTSSVLAGVPLTAGGTYYVRVRPGSTTSTMRPYHLHWVVRSGLPAAEVEPNDVAATAPGGMSWVVGSLSAGTDVDFYTVTLNAGDTIFASLDLDPERDGTDMGTATTLAFGPFTPGPTGNYLTVNDTGSSATSPEAEAIFVTVATGGTYQVRVAGTAAGTYSLSIVVRAAETTCTTYTSSATPLVLNDNGQTTTTITVPATGIVADLDVSLSFTHAAPLDLDVALTSPTRPV